MTTKAKPTPAQVLNTLQVARQHIQTKWVKDAWFTFDDPSSPETKENVVGVCAAGSVLFALDYTDERWDSKADVKPVIEALFEGLPPNSEAMKEYNFDKSNPRRDPYTVKQQYNDKISAIISFNDARGRRKSHVMAMFDTAIEKLTANIEKQTADQTLVIQEVP